MASSDASPIVLTRDQPSMFAATGLCSVIEQLPVFPFVVQEVNLKIKRPNLLKMTTTHVFRIARNIFDSFVCYEAVFADVIISRRWAVGFAGDVAINS